MKKNGNERGRHSTPFSDLRVHHTNTPTPPIPTHTHFKKNRGWKNGSLVKSMAILSENWAQYLSIHMAAHAIQSQGSKILFLSPWALRACIWCRYTKEKGWLHTGLITSVWSLIPKWASKNQVPGVLSSDLYTPTGIEKYTTSKWKAEVQLSVKGKSFKVARLDTKFRAEETG